MLMLAKGPVFAVASPLGIARPLNVANLFGATLDIFADNLMPVPTGCLEYFHDEVYARYVAGVQAELLRRELGWSPPAISPDPPRYCFVRDGEPCAIPQDLRVGLPRPPAVSLERVLRYLDLNHAWAPPMQLLDLLTLVQEDLSAASFAKLVGLHPWVADFMR